MQKTFILLFALTLNALLVAGLKAEDSGRIKILSSRTLLNLESMLDAGKAAGLSNHRSLKLNHPLVLAAKIRGLGRVRSTLSTQRLFNLKNDNYVFLQGEVVVLSGVNSKNASFATLVKDHQEPKVLRLFIVGSTRKAHKNSWRGIVELRAKLESVNGSIRIAKISMHRSKRKNSGDVACIEGVKSTSTNNIANHDGPLTKAEVKIASILLEADLEYVSQIPNSMAEELTTIINGVDTIYQRDLGLSFETTIASSATNYTAPIQYNDDFEILLHNQMASTRPAATRGTDIHFLFTGKTPVGADLANLAGVVPQLGAVCSNPANSIGLTIRIDTATDIVVTSHEIGHLYNAEHDDDFTDPNNPNIMSSVVSGSITSFSSYSMNQVATYVASNSSCLTNGTGNGGGNTPVPTPAPTLAPPITLPATASLYAYKQSKFFIVELYNTSDDSGFANYSVEVLYKKKSKDKFKVSKRLTTNTDGVAAFKPKKDGIYRFRVETLQSKQLKYKKPR